MANSLEIFPRPDLSHKNEMLAPSSRRDFDRGVFIRIFDGVGYKILHHSLDLALVRPDLHIVDFADFERYVLCLGKRAKSLDDPAEKTSRPVQRSMLGLLFISKFDESTMPMTISFICSAFA